MQAMGEITFCGRKFTAQDVELMRVVARDYAGLGVTEIARTLCASYWLGHGPTAG